MTLDNLVSKVLAAGLAAGVFLLWWPAHLPASGVEWLVLRGVAWTLVFEVLALSFSPLERMATRTLARRGPAARARDLRSRLLAAPAPARVGGAVVLACAALLVPALLLAHAGRPPARPAARPITLVRKVVVRREVVRRKTVVVRAPAVVAAPVAQPVRPRTTTQPAAAAAPRTTEPAPKTPARTHETQARKPAASAPASASAPTATPPSPTAADPNVAAGPADAAAPADPPVG